MNAATVPVRCLPAQLETERGSYGMMLTILTESFYSSRYSPAISCWAVTKTAGE